MSVGTLVRVFAAGAVAVAAASPSELVADPPDGWVESGPAPVDLTFEQYAERSPASVEHIERDASAATDIVASVAEWSQADTTVTVEVIHGADHDTALSFVDQAAAIAIASGLAPTDPPFDGAWAYRGPFDGTWVQIVSWAHGADAVIMTEVGPLAGEDDTGASDGRGAIAELAPMQAAHIVDITGVAAGNAPIPEDPSPPDTGGGVPLGLLLLGAAIAAAGLWSTRRRGN